MTEHEIWMLILAPLFSGLVGFLLCYVKYKAVNKVNDLDEKEKAFHLLVDNYEKMTTQMQAQAETNKKLQERLDELSTKLDNIAGGGVALLRDRIIQSCRVFIERGSITLAAKTNIQDMYYFYHDVFHKNSIGEYYYMEAMKLPVVDNVMVPHMPEHHREEMESPL